jgi:hypothetical protein
MVLGCQHALAKGHCKTLEWRIGDSDHTSWLRSSRGDCDDQLYTAPVPTLVLALTEHLARGVLFGINTVCSHFMPIP